MSIYNLVLFLHVATLLFALVVTGILHGSMWLMVRAATVAELRVSARPQQLGVLYAPFILALIGSGFLLLNLSKTSNKFHFSDPFAWTAVVVLVFLFLNGPLILGRHDKVLRKALTGSSNGPVSPELHALTINRTVWFFEFINPFTALGVVLNMATKPNLLWCIVDIGAGVGIGAGCAQFALNRAIMVRPEAIAI